MKNSLLDPMGWATDHPAMRTARGVFFLLASIIALIAPSCVTPAVGTRSEIRC
jgi:hypothetical protein